MKGVVYGRGINKIGLARPAVVVVGHSRAGVWAARDPCVLLFSFVVSLSRASLNPGLDLREGVGVMACFDYPLLTTP